MLVLPSCTKLVHQLRAAKGTKEKTKVLSDNAGPFLAIGDVDSGNILPMESKTKLWQDLNSSGLLEELCGFVENGLPFDNEETSTFTDEVALVEFGLNYIRLLILGCHEPFDSDKEVMQLLCRKLAKLYRSIFVDVKPETLRDPLISVMVYFEPLLLFSCFCERASQTQNFAFVELFPTRNILAFILALHFEPECRLMRIPPNYARATSKHCTAWLESYWADVTRSLDFRFMEVYSMIHCFRILKAVTESCIKDPSPLSHSVSLAFSKYGHNPIAARCCDLFRNPLYRNYQSFEAALNLMMLLLSMKHPDRRGFISIMQEKCIHEDVANACWYPSTKDTSAGTYRHTSLIAKSTVEMLSTLLQTVTDPAILDAASLQHFQDQILLMGRSLITSDRQRLREDEFFLMRLANLLKQFYSGIDIDLKATLFETCMQVARSLREAVRCETRLSEEERTAIIHVWEKIISTIIGMDAVDFPRLGDELLPNERCIDEWM